MSRSKSDEVRALIAEAESLPRVKRIKSNDRMPPRTKAYLQVMEHQVRTWRSPYRKDAVAFMERITPAGLFDLLHSIRRWYSGQTMARVIRANYSHLRTVMKLAPSDVIGVYRGFKVPKDNPLAALSVGDRVTLDVTRNHGFSSWSTTEAPTHKFSGGGKGKVGFVVKLLGGRDIQPVLAPPSNTLVWFNALYREVIGNSFRPLEGEYLISSPSVRVQIVRVKK